MNNLTAATQTVIRFAAVAISVWVVSGAIAFADGSYDSETESEYEALTSDPFESLYSGTTANSLSTQIGSGNSAIIVQVGDEGNELDGIQSGERNTMLVTQVSVFDRNRAEIEQYGNNNLSSLYQEGGDNEYELTQVGDRNMSEAVQYGDDNRFEHVQNGSNLGFSITQYGDSSIKVTQTGY